jgi:hypothetical protein
MSITDELWSLLPAVHRQRDAESPQSGMLQALIDVLGEQGQIVAEDIARLYDNWFIETCDPWVVSYIGDLLGVRMLNDVGPATRLPRAYVANTLAYRRRKGTAAVVEELARDVTGWPAHAIEGFTVLGTTQFLNHLRPSAVQGVSLHDAATLEGAGSPFDIACRTASVRVPPGGISNITDIGVAVWRLQPLPVERATARPVADPPDGRYHLDPVGLDIELINPPQPELTVTSLARPQHVPGVLGRRALYDELEAMRAGTVDDPVFFGDDPVVRVFADTGAGLHEVPTAQLTAADLSDPPPTVSTLWRRPAAPLTAAIDPVLGRLAFTLGVLPDAVEVSYTYATPGDVGAGPYNRGSAATADLLGRASWWRAVGADLPPGTGVVTSLSQAVADWNAGHAGQVGVIAVLDDRSYAADLAIKVAAGSELLVAAGSWPQVTTPDPDDPADPTQLSLVLTRPHVQGNLIVTGGAAPDEQTPNGRALLDGLLIEGGITVPAAGPVDLSVLHCTQVPSAGSVTVGGDSRLELAQSITGPVTLTGEDQLLAASQGIVDGELKATFANITLDRVSVLGDLAGRSLTASDTVVTGQLTIERKQAGCVRFSYVQAGSRTPRRYRCQPDLALDPPVGPVDEASVLARVRPVFASVRFGDSAYGLLADRCADELLTGSSGRSDMGTFGFLHRRQREANLGVALDEYLRFGLVAGLIHAT